MRGLFHATIEQIQPYVDATHWAAMLDIIRITTPIYIGLWDNELICLVGLVPRSILSSSAYLWLYETPLVREHRVVVGRYAKRLIDEWCKTYRLEGHCVTDSWRWLRSLGAIQTSQTTFEIPQWPHR